MDLRRDEHRQMAWGVWHTSALPNSKKHPTLKEFMGTDEEGGQAPTEQKTPAEIRNIMTQWAFVKADVAKAPARQSRAAR